MADVHTSEPQAAIAAHEPMPLHSSPATGSAPALRILSLVARVLLGVVFLVAGAEKLSALDAFGHAIANYQIVPIPLVNIAALLFVWTEIVAGLLLLTGTKVRGSSLVIAMLLGVFLIAILSAMARGLTINCGCFVSAKDIAAAGSAEKAAAAAGDPVGWGKVLEDLGLLLCAIFLVYFPSSYLMLERLSYDSPEGRL
jgi:uncharacterized membrane protein YphA (DoxX/SURF4 family)